MKFLFDLGGVFFDWYPKYFFSSIFEDTDELNFFLTKVCNEKWNIQQDAGRTIVEAENEIIKIFPKFEKQIKMYYLNHRNMIRGVFQDSVQILSKLKSLNYQCYVLSNWSAETFEGMMLEYPFLNKFDGMIISGEDKIVKPDPAIYHLAISRFDLHPNDCVFVDDKLENIDAAIKIGFKAVHLTNPSTIKADIENFLI